jgi:hypothetical protein
MAAKLLEKRFGIKDVQGWMKTCDSDNDGKLSYKEFNSSLKKYLAIHADDDDDK